MSRTGFFIWTGTIGVELSCVVYAVVFGRRTPREDTSLLADDTRAGIRAPKERWRRGKTCEGRFGGVAHGVCP
jgi:hypothetical protein